MKSLAAPLRVGASMLVVWALTAARTHAEPVPMIELDKGEIPQETHQNLRVRLTTENTAPGHQGMAITAKGRGWITVYGLWDNWSAFDRLRMSAHNAAKAPVSIQFELRSRNGGRAAKDIVLKPGMNDVTLPFAEIGKITDTVPDYRQVGQWLFMVPEAMPLPVTVSRLLRVREHLPMPAPTPQRVAEHWSGNDATVQSVRQAHEGRDLYWAEGSFSSTGTGRIWLDLRGGERAFNTPAPLSTWTGYEKLSLLCHNGQPGPVAMEVLLEDFVARGCRLTQFHDKQFAVVPVVAQPGTHRIEVSLAGLKTADGGRSVDLSYIARIGFRVTQKRALQNPRLRFADLRVHTTREDAGVWISPTGGARCGRCEGRVDDTVANACPHCGRVRNTETVEMPPPSADAVRLAAVKDASVNATTGGGGPHVAACNGRSGQIGIHHYDVSMWEERALLRFDPSEAKIEPDRIARAELRLYSTIAGSQGKAYLCPFRVFACDDAEGDFDEASVNWLTQPPAGRHVATSGLYYYGSPGVRCDVTEFVRDRLAESNKPFTLKLCAFEAGAVKRNPHAMGHYMPFESREAKDESRRPCLVVELKK